MIRTTVGVLYVVLTVIVSIGMFVIGHEQYWLILGLLSLVSFAIGMLSNRPHKTK